MTNPSDAAAPLQFTALIRDIEDGRIFGGGNLDIYSDALWDLAKNWDMEVGGRAGGQPSAILYSGSGNR
jgi:hypothetical protein